MSKAKQTISLKTSIVEELPCTGLLSHITTLSGYLPRLGRYLGIPNPEGDREMFRCFLCFTPPPPPFIRYSPSPLASLSNLSPRYLAVFPPGVIYDSLMIPSRGSAQRSEQIIVRIERGTRLELQQAALHTVSPP